MSWLQHQSVLDCLIETAAGIDGVRVVDAADVCLENDA